MKTPTQYLSLTTASIRKMPSGTYLLDYRLRNSAGELVKHSSKSFKKQKDAATFLEELKATHAEAMYREDNPTTTMRFNELYERYETSRVHDKPSTRINRRSLVESRILPFFGDMLISDIVPDTVSQWHSYFYDDKGQPLFSETYLRSLHSRLSAILNYAVNNSWITSNPAKFNSIGAKNATERPVWTPEEYAVFRDAIADEPIGFYAFETLYFTGLRRGELLGLTVSDYDPINRKLTITKCLQRLQGEDVIGSPKTKKSFRTVLLGYQLCSELDEYIKTLPCATPESRLFPISPYKLDSILKKGIKKTGLKPICIHCFRHSHITNLISKQFSPVDIANRVGHESIYITLHYSHAYDSIENRMANALDEEMEVMNNAK